LGENFGVMDGEIRHDLPIYGDPGFSEQTYKFGVRDTFKVSPGPDSGDPENTEIPFSQLPSPICLSLGTHDCPTSGTMEFTSPAPEAFSQFSDLFSPAMSGRSSLYSCHCITSLNIRFLFHKRVAIRQNTPVLLQQFLYILRHTTAHYMVSPQTPLPFAAF
jgi:hypothetical protein